MKKKYRIIKIEVERHWVILAAVTAIVSLLWLGSAYADQANCTKENPLLDCNQRGTIDISNIRNNSTWTQTTGFGVHWEANAQGFQVPQPEFRNGYYHAICSINNSTCFWHIDKYPATQDIPFGTILHLADYLTITVSLFGETVWQLILWIAIVLGITGLLEGTARLTERFL